MARQALAATLFVVAACKSSKSKLDTPLGSGSSAAPTGSVAAGSGSAMSCDDAAIKAHVQTAMEASKRYFDALQAHASTWARDCEAIRKDLLTLEPDGDAFVASMTAMRDWAKTLPSDCRERIQMLGEQNPLAIELEGRTPALEAKVAPTLDACKDHPGFKDAAAKGLRLLKKKKT